MFSSIAKEAVVKEILEHLDADIQKAEDKVKRLGYSEDRAYLQGLQKAKALVNSIDIS
jgi:hypothetical protein